MPAGKMYRYGRRFRRGYGKKKWTTKYRARIRPRLYRSLKWKNIYWFKRSFTTIVAAEGQGQDKQLDANGFICFTNKLSDLPDYAEFTNLFMQYRIFKVVSRIQYISTQVANKDAEPGGDNQQHMIQYVYDYRDDDALTEAQMNQFQRTKVKALINGGRPIHCVHKPKYKDLISSDGTTATPFGLANTRKGWIDSASADVVHFGIKAIFTTLDTFTPDDNFLIRLDQTVHLGFRNVT